MTSFKRKRVKNNYTRTLATKARETKDNHAEGPAGLCEGKELWEIFWAEGEMAMASASILAPYA